MASQVTRFAWTDDSGTPASPVGNGTKINNAQLQLIFDAVDAVFSAATFIVGGVFTAEGFGTHSISASGAGTNRLRVVNTSAGTTNRASVDVGNDAANDLGRFLALSSTHTASGYLTTAGVVLEANGAGGLSLAATNASAAMRFYTNSLERVRIAADGKVNIGHTTSGNDLDVRSSADGTAGLAGLRIRRDDGSYLILNMDDGGAGNAWGSIQPGDGSAFRPLRLAPSSQCHFADGSAASPSLGFVNDIDTGFFLVSAVTGNIGMTNGGSEWFHFVGNISHVNVLTRALGNGVTGGPYITIGRNSTGGGAAGHLNLTRRGGAVDVVWSDASGNLRIGGSAPTEDNTTVSDTSGTVVGTQTSTRASKQDIESFTDYAGALGLIERTPLYRFRYRAGDTETPHVGIMADESPEFARYAGTAFDPVNAFGYAAAAIKALAARVEALESRLAS